MIKPLRLRLTCPICHEICVAYIQLSHHPTWHYGDHDIHVVKAPSPPKEKKVSAHQESLL